MTPDAHKRAIPVATLIIISFHHLGLPVAIIIPPITIKTKDTMRIIVTNILVKLHINTGNAFNQVTPVSSPPTLPVLSSIHFPIKGMLVLSDIPQQTLGSEHDLHVPLTFFVHVGQVHAPNELIFHPTGEEQEISQGILALRAWHWALQHSCHHAPLSTRISQATQGLLQALQSQAVGSNGSCSQSHVSGALHVVQFWQVSANE